MIYTGRYQFLTFFSKDGKMSFVEFENFWFKIVKIVNLILFF
jgi:hypothetical protein